ncbi:MAG: response regulator [Lachnospiraceae bacterium]
MLEIAVCDDSRTDIELLEKALDRFHQYPVNYDVFFSGKELLDYCEKYQKVYHLYIFDIEMPGMDGVELAGKIRGKDKNGPMSILWTKKVERLVTIQS